MFAQLRTYDARGYTPPRRCLRPDGLLVFKPAPVNGEPMLRYPLGPRAPEKVASDSFDEAVRRAVVTTCPVHHRLRERLP